MRIQLAKLRTLLFFSFLGWLSFLGADETKNSLTKLQIGTHLSGAVLCQKDLAGKIVVFEKWGFR